jgi:tetratricopeptide (TPR) repeat protein
VSVAGLLAAGLLAAALPAAVRAQSPVDTARALLQQYHDDPTSIDRARELLEGALAKNGADVQTLIALARAWFLHAEQRAATEDARLAAYERSRDLGRRAAELAPANPDAHLAYAIGLGSWARAKGLLRSALALRTIREEVATVLRLDPSSIQAHIMAGSINRELPAVLGGDRAKAEAHFKTARSLDPHLTGVRLELAMLYIDMGGLVEARRELQDLLDERTPTDRARWTVREAPRARALLESIRDRP